MFSDGGETQADFSEAFPDYEGEEERSGDFYIAPASPITVPYCPPRPPSGKFQVKIIFLKNPDNV